MIKIGVMGYGTIGSGVVRVIEENNEVISARIGDSIEVKSVLDIREFEGNPIHDKIVHDYKQLAADPEISIVVETMGGVEPAFTFTKAMLEAGKSVVTSNKAVVAAKGPEIFQIAKANNVSYLFEASVGGGIPIIRSIEEALTADVIEEISGILNGTTNYILTKMTMNGMEYADALKEAQDLGYAEKPDPIQDVGGFDPARKISILTSLVSGRKVDYEKVYTEGITKISAADIKYAEAMGKRVKLLASSYLIDGSYVVMVAPFLVPSDHALYQVSNAMNAVFVKGNMLGDAMFYGAGAGSLPTASAVVGDVVEIAKNAGRRIDMSWSGEELKLRDYTEMENRFFVRTIASKAKIETVFGKVEYISVKDVENETAFVTEKMKEADFITKKAVLGDNTSAIRIK